MRTSLEGDSGPRRLVRAGLVACVFAMGSVVSGCASQSAQQPPTRVSFIKAADARCISATRAGVNLDFTDMRHMSAQLRQTIAARSELGTALKSLAAPPADQAALTAFFEAYDRHLASLRDMQAAAAAGNAVLATQLGPVQGDRMTEMEKQAVAYGFSFCGRF